jgi:mono/diheme cytochrome c family protein
LEGLNVLKPELVRAAMKDSDAQTRAQGIRLAEALIKKGDLSFVPEIKAMRTDSDPSVVLQAICTSRLLNWPDWKKEAQKVLMTSTSAGVREVGSQLVAEAPRIAGDFTRDQRKQLERGQEAYLSLCFACHGFDGMGTPIAGREDGATLAPPLAGSRTVVQGDSVLRVLLNGLAGPVNGKTYESQMVTMASNDDQWLADVVCYLRKAFGNAGKLVTKQEVTALRKSLGGRTEPWTHAELAKLYPQPLTNRTSWKLTASHAEKELGRAIDGDITTRWDTHKPQSPEMWLQIALPEETEITGLILDTGRSGGDYPRGYAIDLSSDGTTWGKPVLQGNGSSGMTDYTFANAAKAKFIRIRQTGSTTGTFWSIHELEVLGPRPAAQ